MSYVEPACLAELAEMVTAAVPGVVLCKCRPECKGGAWRLSFQRGPFYKVDVRWFAQQLGFVVDRRGVHGGDVRSAAEATVAALTEAAGPRGRSAR